MRKLTKKNYAYTRNKGMSDANREIEKEYMKNYYNKRRKLLIHLTNYVEELENICP